MQARTAHSPKEKIPRGGSLPDTKKPPVRAVFVGSGWLAAGSWRFLTAGG